MPNSVKRWIVVSSPPRAKPINTLAFCFCDYGDWLFLFFIFSFGGSCGLVRFSWLRFSSLPGLSTAVLYNVHIAQSIQFHSNVFSSASHRKASSTNLFKNPFFHFAVSISGYKGFGNPLNFWVFGYLVPFPSRKRNLP
jgi:hypothetical protein